eukprot:SAG11_NODE_1505_length_4782_cov_2.698270_3_plen_127_part_00
MGIQCSTEATSGEVKPIDEVASASRDAVLSAHSAPGGKLVFECARSFLSQRVDFSLNTLVRGAAAEESPTGKYPIPAWAIHTMRKVDGVINFQVAYNQFLEAPGDSIWPASGCGVELNASVICFAG